MQTQPTAPTPAMHPNEPTLVFRTHGAAGAWLPTREYLRVTKKSITPKQRDALMAQVERQKAVLC